MKLETFDSVLQSIKKNQEKRQFHLLLGNGFSMAYDPEIFSYNALHEFVTKLEDDDLKKILGILETRNFELIMQQLDNLSTLILAFGGDKTLKTRVDRAGEKLKSSLLNAVQSLHPEHVFKIPEEKSKLCNSFLEHFLNTGGDLFSTNYDLLLYWALMRNQVGRHGDGFGLELENPDEVALGEDEEWSELLWGKNREDQNVFYLHGALQFFDTGIHIIKEKYDGVNFLLDQISKRMQSGQYPIFVTSGTGQDKLKHIMHNRYLSWCYDRLCHIEGTLVSFGFNFGEYDEHIIDAINQAAKQGKNIHPKLLSVYIGVYNDDDKKHIERLENKFKCKVRIFDSKTAGIWEK